MPKEGRAGDRTEEVVLIQELKRQGLSISAIARQTGLDRKTVKKYLASGLEAPAYTPRKPATSAVEPHRQYLLERMANYPGLSSRRLHREIRGMGYKGAYSSLTEYLRQIRPPVPKTYERRFETGAGVQAQVDFAEFQTVFTSEPGVVRKVWLFSMVLGHSRWLWGVLPEPGTGNGDALPYHGLRGDGGLLQRNSL
jgi:transposase